MLAVARNVIPSPMFPLMTFPLAAFGPPIRMPLTSASKTPLSPLPRAAVPLAFVPIVLPAITAPATSDVPAVAWRATPSWPLAEITLPRICTPVTDPPELKTRTPAPALAMAAVPARLRPT